MTQEPNQNKTPEKTKKNGLTIAIVVLILVVIGLVIWQITMRSTLKNLLEEKEIQRAELKQELDSLLIEHENVKHIYGELSDSLAVKDSIISANAEEIEKLLDTQWEYYKVKKKLAQLQVIAQGYVRQMDSLYRENAALQEENIAMKQNLNTLKQEVETISKDREELNQKVQLASWLQAYNVNATGIRLRSGGSKEVETDKVQRVDEIKVCFTIGQNEIAELGNREIFVRIARPDKEILTPGKIEDYTFDYEGQKLQYSIMERVYYERQPMDLCLYWKKNYSSQELNPGLYYVDIFCDGTVIGQATFSLR